MRSQNSVLYPERDLYGAKSIYRVGSQTNDLFAFVLAYLTLPGQ
jgi:hypothetical protein